MVMVNHLFEMLRLPHGRTVHLGGEERVAREPAVPGADFLSEFRLERGLPVWRFHADGCTIEKRILLVHGQNTVHVNYRLIDGKGPLRLKVFPSLHFRPHEAAVDAPMRSPYIFTAVDHRYEVRTEQVPPLRLMMHGRRACFTLESQRHSEIMYRLEK